ncbi:MAG: HNH endonuclease [Methanosarcinales archaeon]
MDDKVNNLCQFDTQKMANPKIQSVQYQQGTLQGYEIKCVYCKGKSGYKLLGIEHVIPKSRGGTDRVGNLVIACDLNPYKSLPIVFKGKPVKIPNTYLLERQIKKRQPVHRLWNENKNGRSVWI